MLYGLLALQLLWTRMGCVPGLLLPHHSATTQSLSPAKPLPPLACGVGMQTVVMVAKDRLHMAEPLANAHAVEPAMPYIEQLPNTYMWVCQAPNPAARACQPGGVHGLCLQHDVHPCRPHLAATPAGQTHSGPSPHARCTPARPCRDYLYVVNVLAPYYAPSEGGGGHRRRLLWSAAFSHRSSMRRSSSGGGGVPVLTPFLNFNEPDEQLAKRVKQLLSHPVRVVPRRLLVDAGTVEVADVDDPAANTPNLKVHGQ